MTGRAKDFQDDELVGVDPRRRALVRKRLQIVRRYLALPTPSRRDDEEFAAELGIAPPSFLVLVRAYRAHGSAAAMPGAKVAVKNRIRDARMPDLRTEAAVSQALGELGLDATSIELLERVEEICRSTGARPPSIGVVQLRRARARRTAGATGVQGLVLDHIALDLPITVDGDALALPVLTAVLEGETGRVTGWSLDTRPPTPRAAAAALMMAAGRTGPVIGPLDMSIGASTEWGDLCRALEASGIDRVGSNQPRLRAGGSAFRMLGDRLSGIQLLPRKVNRPKVARLRSRFRYKFHDAVDAVRVAIETHNGTRGPSPLASPVTADRREDLLAMLRLIVDDDDAPQDPARTRPI